MPQIEHELGCEAIHDKLHGNYMLKRPQITLCSKSLKNNVLTEVSQVYLYSVVLQSCRVVGSEQRRPVGPGNCQPKSPSSKEGLGEVCQPWVLMAIVMKRLARAKALWLCLFFCPFRASFYPSLHTPGHCPGLVSCWPCRPLLPKHLALNSLTNIYTGFYE